METIDALEQHLKQVQEDICAELQSVEAGAKFTGNQIEARGGYSRPWVLQGGETFDKAAVLFSRASGPALPPAAVENRPNAAGHPFHAVSVSLIVHPLNPYVPAAHANFRHFRVAAEAEEAWWYGGGYDLTPSYCFPEDAVHWHQVARTACSVLGDQAYSEFKRNCDEYFFLPHRGEARGIGGLFFDDLFEPGDSKCGEFFRAVSSSFADAYVPLVRRRMDTPFGDREKEFQLYRRGRYAEFNLLYDRGTRYGLQSGGNVESILASMPPRARWEYGFQAEPGSPEAELLKYLKPRDWV